MELSPKDLLRVRRDRMVVPLAGEPEVVLTGRVFTMSLVATSCINPSDDVLFLEPVEALTSSDNSACILDVEHVGRCTFKGMALLITML